MGVTESVGIVAVLDRGEGGLDAVDDVSLTKDEEVFVGWTQVERTVAVGECASADFAFLDAVGILTCGEVDALAACDVWFRASVFTTDVIELTVFLVPNLQTVVGSVVPELTRFGEDWLNLLCNCRNRARNANFAALVDFGGVADSTLTSKAQTKIPAQSEFGDVFNDVLTVGNVVVTLDENDVSTLGIFKAGVGSETVFGN